jgi:recombinational DNA repair protein (RecF pathway)
MVEWNGCCDACGRRTANFVMSMYGQSLVCPHCREMERYRSRAARLARTGIRRSKRKKLHTDRAQTGFAFR